MQWYFLSDTQEQVPVKEEHLAGLVQTGVVRSNTMIWREGMEQWAAASELKPELFARRQVVPLTGAAATARINTAATPQAQAAPTTTPLTPGGTTAPVTGVAVPAGTTGAMHLGDGPLVREAARILAGASVWMKLLGVLSILVGIGYIVAGLFVMVTGVGAGAAGVALIVSSVTAGFGAVILWMGMLLFQSASKANEAAVSGQKIALFSALSQNARFFKIWGICAALALLVYGLMFGLMITGALGGSFINAFRGGSGGGFDSELTPGMFEDRAGDDAFDFGDDLMTDGDEEEDASDSEDDDSDNDGDSEESPF